MTDWLPIETKPPATRCEERGEYRSNDGLLWYFKPTHWRPIGTSTDHSGAARCENVSTDTAKSSEGR